MKKGLALVLFSVFMMVPLTASAKVALFENFSTGTLSSRWTAYSHGGPSTPELTAEVVDFEGNKVLKMSGAGVVAAGDPAWTDYTVEGDVYVYDASYSAYAAGVLFRGTGQFGSSSTADAYVYQGRPGEMQLEKWINGGWWQQLTNDYAHPFTAGVWHRFKIICEGNHFQFFVDNVLTQEYTDPAAALAGQIGLRIWDAGAYFDNIMVTTKETLPPGVVLSEDFSEGVLDPRWDTEDQGGLGYEIVKFEGNDVLKITGSGVVAIGDPTWTDYTAEADVYIYDSWYSAYAAGLMTRVQGPLSNWYDMSAYVLEARPYYVELEKWTKSLPWQDLRDFYTPFTANAWHHMKAVCVGPRITLYMDNVQVADYTDYMPHLTGQVGLRTYIVGAYYDNLKVTLDDVTAPTTTVAVSGTAGNNGWFISDVTASLSATDSQSEVKEIHYTIDAGTETIVSGSAASIVISTEGVHTISYHAVDATAGNNVEAAKTLTVSIDKAAPATVAAISGTAGANGWNKSDAVVTLTAADGAAGIAATEYSFDNVAWTPYTASVTITAEGSTTLYYRSVDAAGNAEAAKYIVVNVDKTAPQTAAAAAGSMGDNNTYRSDVQVTLSASDNASGIGSIEYSFDGATWNTYAAPVNITNNGTTTIQFRSTDNAGNVGAAGSLTVAIDKVVPAVTSTTPANNQINVDTDANIVVTFSENIVAGSAYGNIMLKKGTTAVSMAKTISGNKLTIHPSNHLSDETVYTVTIPADGIKDMAGNGNSAFNLRFTTED